MAVKCQDGYTGTYQDGYTGITSIDGYTGITCIDGINYVITSIGSGLVLRLTLRLDQD